MQTLPKGDMISNINNASILEIVTQIKEISMLGCEEVAYG